MREKVKAMWSQIQYQLHLLSARALNSMANFSYREWLVVSGVALVLGILCLRGFGSRTNY